jgi:D-alanyl-D-alanine-carboxypeptidase/D-alanyl-D-alanine-endopeptidase
MRGGIWPRLTIALALATGIIASPQSGRTDEAGLREAVELTATAMWLDYKSPGLILAVVRGPDAAVLGFGETAKGSKTEPNGRSVLRLGSISKAFAGELLASLAADGHLRLGDPAAKFLPGASLPEAGGRPITLIDLATHAAGLPRDLPGEPKPGTNPFDRFGWEADKAFLASAKVAFPPGTGAAYSNLGFDVLGAALAGAGGASYADLLKSRVTGPLGMDDTVLRLSDSQKARLMVGHDFDGSPLKDFDMLEAQAASGSLFSTADDMVRFMRWHLNRQDPTGDAVRVIDHALYLQRDGLERAIGFDEGDPMSAIGLGWLGLAPEGPRPFLLAKSGGMQGFMTYLAFAPSRGVAVFVAVNQFNFGGFLGLAKAVDGLVAELAPR